MLWGWLRDGWGGIWDKILAAVQPLTSIQSYNPPWLGWKKCMECEQWNRVLGAAIVGEGKIPYLRYRSRFSLSSMWVHKALSLWLSHVIQQQLRVGLEKSFLRWHHAPIWKSHPALPQEAIVICLMIQLCWRMRRVMCMFLQCWAFSGHRSQPLCSSRLNSKLSSVWMTFSEFVCRWSWPPERARTMIPDISGPRVTHKKQEESWIGELWEVLVRNTKCLESVWEGYIELMFKIATLTPFTKWIKSY